MTGICPKALVILVAGVLSEETVITWRFQHGNGGINVKFTLKPQAKQEEEITWVGWTKPLSEEGSFTITPSTVVFKEEKEMFALIDRDNEIGTTVYCSNHPNAKFESTPHGIRLANAIGRAFDLEGEVDVEQLVSLMNDSKTEVRVEKTEKGVLWTVSILEE
jgi:hypothetical protein